MAFQMNDLGNESRGNSGSGSGSSCPPTRCVSPSLCLPPNITDYSNDSAPTETPGSPSCSYDGGLLSTQLDISALTAKLQSLIMTSLTITRGSEEIEVECTEELVQIISSPDTEDATKQIIVDNLLESHKVSKEAGEKMPLIKEADQTSSNQTWTKSAEKLLLTEYRLIDESKPPTKNKWKKISTIIADKGYDFTAEQCRLKYRAIKEKYQKEKKKSNTSGEGGSATDSQIEEIFENCPDVKPKATLDSEVPTNTPGSVANEDKTEDRKTEEMPKPKQKKRRSGTEDIKDFLLEREKEQERRHQERMATTKELINILGKLADK